MYTERKRKTQQTNNEQILDIMQAELAEMEEEGGASAEDLDSMVSEIQ